jgi:predicted DNA-binding transcriptional regulator YafY
MKDIRHELLRHLLNPGLPPNEFPPEMLLYWTARPRNPVLASNDDLAKMFIEAMLTGEPVKFIYCGGSTPGATRSVKVSLVFQHEPQGRVYVSGYCPERSANRVFSLDLIMVVEVRN